ncbi:MAG: MotA/TolQ/ExbB proton channel family protein [Luminiphilus sp.]|nr:MotA/TolQ/ExbB proton channel family protein [Luminiphilus sp.]
MYQVLSAGGWVMPFIVLCSIIALAICIERQFALNRKKIAPPHLLATVWQQLRGEGLDAQRLKNLRQGSPLGAILAAGLANRHQGRDVMRESIQEAASHVIHQLERYLNTLGTVAAVTPLMGLLGTVLGMISVFTEITTYGTGNAGALAGGISEALITTAAGLAVAIPSLVMHRHYTSRIESIVVDLEREAIKLVDAIHSNQKTEYDL